MRRCLQIARGGRLTAKPNPSVGAVIVAADGRIIGEGFTSAYGGPHAEVNAFASVRPADEALLTGATIYVSLEPCSHWGHTPPCCDLIIRKGVRRCVCGCADPFAQVQGRGIERMRQAGIEVTVGVLRDECMASNRAFMTVNERHRPFILLKWAETANHIVGYKAQRCLSVPQRENGMQQPTQGHASAPLRLSSPFTQMLVHRLRAQADAILVGRGTLEADHPRLDVREWSGPSPERLVLTRHPERVPEGFLPFADIPSALAHLSEHKRQSLIVEGGPTTLQAFIDADLWDEIRVETAPFTVGDGVKAPEMPDAAVLGSTTCYDGRVIRLYRRR